MVSAAAFHARVRGSLPGLGRLKETKMFLPHPFLKLSIVGNLRDREVACSASDLQGLNFESCVRRAVSSHSSPHPQEALTYKVIHKCQPVYIFNLLKPLNRTRNLRSSDHDQLVVPRVSYKLGERVFSAAAHQLW